jgi:uncharacterized OB-fold protein
MDIDFKTGKVSYPVRESREQIRQSIDDMKIKNTNEESVFSKTQHHGLPYGRLKYMLYCFLLMVDGIIGLVSFGQTQSILANKYLLSDHVMGDYDADRQNSS